ncbi:hypothetical protein ACM66B_006899 [Microbotryomycetes sp. NB124-2]
MDASALLNATLSPHDQERAQATEQLQQVLAQDPKQYLGALSHALASDQTPSHIRRAAGLAIKNALSAREQHRQDEYAQRWTHQVDPQTRELVKQHALQTLASPDKQARTSAGQVTAAVAAIELPAGLWPSLIAQLLELAGHQDNSNLRQATLQTIGYICESIKPEVLAAQSNEILTAVVQGARKEEPSTDVQMAAIHALYNSLEFVKDNFAREGERNYIMQVVCEATQSASSEVQIGAFECLVRIMHLYYDYMKYYMERALFGLTILGMKHADEGVALQAVEFWSTVCDEEIELALEAEEAAEFSEAPERESSHFARVALPEILPVLLQLLTRQEEDAEDDEWNVSMAAGTCLALLAQTVGDAIVTPIIPFVEGNIKNADWRFREAAVMAFGSILDGPEERILAPLVSQALPTLIEMMRDPSPHVRDTVAWTLGRVTDVLIKTIDPEVHIRPLVVAVVEGLEQSPRIVANCCWTIMNLAEQLADAESDTSVLSPFYDPLVTALLNLAQKDTNEQNARTSAYEALSTLAAHAPANCLQVVSRLVVDILNRSEALLALERQIVSSDDRNNYTELQINVCTVLTSVARRLGAEIQPLSDRIMTLLLQLIQSAGKQSPILEDAFLAVGAMTAALDQNFQAYLQAFLPFLHSALTSHEEYQLCSIAVGLIGDICRALGEACQPYCQGFMEVLLNNLQSTVLHRSVKPPILSCFGDIALAIGPAFEPFLETTMNVLQQAGAMRADPNNYDLVDYINGLRESILEAYTGIVGGLKTGGKADILLPHVNGLLNFLHIALTDQDRTEAILKSTLGLIGDLAEAFPNGQLKEPLSQAWVGDVLKAGRTKMGSSETKKIAKWAKEMVRRATQ